MRYLDMPQAVAMVVEQSKVWLYQECDLGWEFPQAVVEKLDWPEDRFQLEVFKDDDFYLDMYLNNNSFY
jgi:hypothetical protein